ncbi:MAG: hypothetical protein V9F06_01845 [Thermomicrobiales bacterium]
MRTPRSSVRDEAFFGDGDENRIVVDLYNEKAGILDADADDDTDLSSRALADLEQRDRGGPAVEGHRREAARRGLFLANPPTHAGEP